MIESLSGSLLSEEIALSRNSLWEKRGGGGGEGGDRDPRASEKARNFAIKKLWLRSRDSYVFLFLSQLSHD